MNLDILQKQLTLGALSPLYYDSGVINGNSLNFLYTIYNDHVFFWAWTS